MIADSLPFLGMKLRQAGMVETPEQFVKKVFITSTYMTFGIVLIAAAVFSKMKFLVVVLAFLFPIIFFVMFIYFAKLPEVKIIKKRKQIDREIAYAGRFLMIGMDSGILLYDAMSNVAKTYKEVGVAFNNILHTIDLGTNMEDALNEAIEQTPSFDFRRVLWQILNSLKTGSDVSDSLKAVLDQITKEQTIEIKNYAKKLNPFAMFYMLIAVILPSLGITMLIVLSSFVAMDLNLTFLLIIAVVLGILQFIFFTLIKSSRPAVSI